MLSSIIKIFIALWPFIKEMFFAGKSVRQVIMENKLLTFVLTMLVFSVTLNFVSFGKLLDIAVARSDDPVHTEQRDKTKDKPVVTGPPPQKSASEPQSKPKDEIDKQLEDLYGPRG